MIKKILITGATDGLGYLAAKELIRLGHQVLIHGRSREKLDRAMTELQPAGSLQCELSDLDSVHQMSKALPTDLDVLINNAGIFRTTDPITPAGMDVRFVVNTLAPLQLSLAAVEKMHSESRIINLSSAAQAPVNLDALAGTLHLDDEFQAYAQSKLALTQWTRHLAHQTDVLMCSVNPASLLATKMVSEGFGLAGSDPNKGRDILIRAALSEGFAQHLRAQPGAYFDNDLGDFGPPHLTAENPELNRQVYEACKALIPAP